VNWAPGEPSKLGGDCAALDSGFFETVQCDTPSNFICEARELQKYIYIKIGSIFFKLKFCSVPQNFKLLPIDHGS